MITDKIKEQLDGCTVQVSEIETALGELDKRMDMSAEWFERLNLSLIEAYRKLNGDIKDGRI